DLLSGEHRREVCPVTQLSSGFRLFQIYCCFSETGNSLFFVCLRNSVYKKYMADLSHVIEHPLVDIQPDLSFEEHRICIVDRKTQELRTKSILLVKVLWQHHSFEEVTWELEEEVRRKYPELFGMFSFP